MITVVQRVTRAAVLIDGREIARIRAGLVALTAIERGDDEAAGRWMAAKLASLRLFPDATGEEPYDRDVRQIGGSLLLISNFTVAASCARGRRPSLEGAAPPQEAEPAFARLVQLVKEQQVVVETGQFGAMMQVELVNDGPVTLLLHSPR